MISFVGFLVLAKLPKLRHFVRFYSCYPINMNRALGIDREPDILAVFGPPQPSTPAAYALGLCQVELTPEDEPVSTDHSFDPTTEIDAEYTEE